MLVTTDTTDANSADTITTTKTEKNSFSNSNCSLRKETGISHSTWLSNMLLLPYKTFFIFYLYVSSVAAAEPAHECNSMDIRNMCENFVRLENCTVITGYLIIVLLPSSGETCDYEQYKFPKLREITDYMLINEVKNLTTLVNMFPNLTVIRGQRLFRNYALGITRMNELTTIEFPSLIAIQRGHVLIGLNPKLCHLKTINFDRLTLTRGDNHIAPAKDANCSIEDTIHKCKDCPSGSCWSKNNCQWFENDNIINNTQGILNCDDQCLGGCYNGTAQDCVVCRSWSHQGSCVKSCPDDTFASKHYLRCYTREECIAKKLFIYKNSCVSACPAGYELNNATQVCDSCGGVNNCTKICNPPKEPFCIYTLSDMETLKGCQILNGSVFFNMRNPINEQELEEHFEDVREIIGHLKVYRSPHLTSLAFLKNLQKIHGKPLENKQYSLIIYNNRNLSTIWPVNGNVEFLNGGMFIHFNDRLCNRNIRKFKNAIRHDNSLDSLQTSDQEVLCSPSKLNLGIEVLSHRSLKFSWPIQDTADEIEIIYRPIPFDKPFSEHNELETRICERINWQRDLKFPSELAHNASHYFYIVDELKAHTKYACLIKTFDKDDDHEARSELQFATTEIDRPTPPLIKVYNKSYESMEVKLYYNNREDELVDYYYLEVYKLNDNKQMLDHRDYCEDPMRTYPDYHNEDYEDCCSRHLEEQVDNLFRQQLQTEFTCSLDRLENCERNSLEDNITKNTNALIAKRLEHSENSFKIQLLERYQLYAIQVQACNHAGCGSFKVITERTNFVVNANSLGDWHACKMPNSYEYHISFKEPIKPNGPITTYMLHFQYTKSFANASLLNHIHCLTRQEHEQNHYVYVAHLNSTFNEAAIRVESFGQHMLEAWKKIEQCQITTKLAGRSSHGWNVFLIFFLLGAASTSLWICYKRKYWRKLPQLRRYIPWYFSWRSLRTDDDDGTDDRQMLVDGFETVRFHNSPDEDMKHLVH